MNKFTKRAIGLLVSLTVAISMCLGATAIFATNANNPSDTLTTYQTTSLQKAPVNGGNANSDMFYFEIIPEILLDDNNAIFTSPFDTPGKLRNPFVLGGSINKFPTVKSVWEKVAFNVYDENGNLIETKTGTISGHGRWSGAKYIGPYKKGHNYTISVDTSTLPDGYYSYLTDVPSGHNPEDITKVKDFRNAEYDKSFKEDYAAVRFNMDVISVLYAKNEDVAKNQFTLDDKGKTTGWNTKYKNGDDYILKTIDKNGNFVIPTKEEMEKLADEGYRPNGFYFYMIDKGEKQKIGPLYEKLPTTFKLFRNGFNYLRSYKDNDGINTFNKYKNSGIFTMVLDQSVPKVTFDRNFDDPKDPNTEVGTLNVYYKKSLKTNCVGNSCGSKSLPKAPTRKGKVFAGWNTKPDGSGDKFTINTKVTDDVIVYAQWKDKEVNPNPNTPADTKNTPKTGDNTLDILYIVFIAMVMSTGLLLILKKRKSIK